MSNDIKTSITARDAEEMLDTATQNPDKTDFTCPPDGVRGLSTITRQKIATDLSFTGDTGGALSDVWIVQWDHEPTLPNASSGSWFLGNAEEDTNGYVPGQLILASSLGSGWTGTYATSLITGGLCIYYMPPGTSPFPSSTAGKGPIVPTAVKQLVYSTDVMHDLVRVLGSNYELVDVTNALNQQGTCFQGAWDANQEDQQSYQLQIGTGGTTGTSVLQAFVARPGLCPPGNVQELIKLNNNRMAAAKEGTFVMNRLDWANNKPSSQDGVSEVYQSITDHPVCGGRRLYLGINNQNSIQIVSSAGTPNTSIVTLNQNGTQSCRVYPTAVQMNATVLVGLNATWSASLSREMTTQCFIRPGSLYSAFARMSYMPVDYGVLGALQNVMDNLQMFAPSKSNKTGKFAKMAKSLWKKVAPVVKPIAGIAGTALRGYAPESVNQAFDAAKRVVERVNEENPYEGALREFGNMDLLDYTSEGPSKAERRKAAVAAAMAEGGVAAEKIKEKLLAKKAKKKSKKGESSKK
jgi:hypothetical protein